MYDNLRQFEADFEEECRDYSKKIDRIIKEKQKDMFVKEIEGKHYLALNSVIVNRVKYTSFIESDKDGNIQDVNKNGIIDGFTLVCKLKKNQTDVDISKLSDDCFKKAEHK